MSEHFPGSVAETPKPEATQFETLADGLSGETRERYLGLEEQVNAIKQLHGGSVDDERLTSAERLLIDEYNELRELAFKNIRLAE